MELLPVKADLGFSLSISGFHITAQLSDSLELKGQSTATHMLRHSTPCNKPDSVSQKTNSVQIKKR